MDEPTPEEITTGIERHEAEIARRYGEIRAVAAVTRKPISATIADAGDERPVEQPEEMDWVRA